MEPEINDTHASNEPDPAISDREVAEALFARSVGLVTPVLSRRRVVCVGLGSVGSYVSEQLVRSGVGSLSLIDPDRVEANNLCRTTYALADLGQPKAAALAERLAAIHPGVKTTVFPRALQDFSMEEVRDLFTGADLVLAMTDDPRAQSLLNRFARHHGIPAIFTGLYQLARGGEVVLSVPGQSPCYACATGGRREAESITESRVSRDTDYGSGRLVGEPALGCDIQHVASATVKLALSLLLRGEDRAALAGFAPDALAKGFGTLTLSMTPHFWFYPGIFGETPGQFAYQGVWLSFTSAPECPVCGNEEHREDPYDQPLAGPTRESLRDLAGETAPPPSPPITLSP